MWTLTMAVPATNIGGRKFKNLVGNTKVIIITIIIIILLYPQ